MADGGRAAAAATAVDRAIGKLRKQSRLLLVRPSASVRLCLHDGPKRRNVIKVRPNLSFVLNLPVSHRQRRLLAGTDLYPHRLLGRRWVSAQTHLPRRASCARFPRGCWRKTSRKKARKYKGVSSDQSRKRLETAQHVSDL